MEGQVLHKEVAFIGLQFCPQLLEMNASHGVVYLGVGDLGSDGVLVRVGDGQLHVGREIKMSHVEKAALGPVGVLARLVVVGRETQPVGFYPSLLVAFVQCQCSNAHLILHLATLGHPVPGAFHLSDLHLSASSLVLNEAEAAQRETCIVILSLYIFDNHLLDIDDHGRFLALVHIWNGVGSRFLLEGIEDELVVSHRIGGVVVQFRTQTHDGGFGYMHLAVQ